ncbi:hypothetical protein [Pseudomonas sp. ML96]|uniref:hypothetical protein n=1 Tax=Pseudomonas sp. ML96 TaxID=1523503 RepID=UPI0005BBB822|nr:hypothetical protein [Pseudomonas sp. ML96]
MKASDLLAIALRISALYLLFRTFLLAVQQYQYVSQLANVSYSGKAPGAAILGIAMVLGLGLVSLALLKFPVTIARWLTPATADKPLSINLSVDELQSAAFCVLGVYLIAMGLADFANNGMWIIYILRGGELERNNLAAYFINQLITLVEFAIGLALCLKSDGLSQFIRRLRTAGAPGA